MSTATRALAFVAGLALVLAAAFGVGRLVDPVQAEPVAHDTDGHGEGSADSPGHEAGGSSHGSAHGGAEGGAHGGHEDGGQSAATLPAGLQRSEDGYTLALEETVERPGRSVDVRFTITGPDGTPVTTYQRKHAKLLHLIAVRRDGSGFQHVHPTLSADGTWQVPLDLTAGTWRVFADFAATGGPALTLGTDLFVPGQQPAPGDERPTRTAEVDGYVVSVRGNLTPGEATQLDITVRRNGEPVTDLQPYLEAYGHLVALRDGDLAYLHVHPEGAPAEPGTRAGPTVAFATEVPSRGRYRLYFDFRHAGSVHTAQFLLDAGGPGGAGTTPEGGHDDHAH